MQSVHSAPARVALIGITGFGQTHLNTIRQLQADGLVRLVAAAVINRSETEALCRELEAGGTCIYDSYEALFAAEKGKIDVTFIPTGIAWHTTMTLAALSAGSHVYLEKPAAGTAAEVDAMIRASAQTGKQVAVGFQDLYSDAVLEVKKRLDDGELGTLREVAVLGHWPRPSSYYARNNWAGRIEVNGQRIYDSPANNALSHYLAQALFFASPGDRQLAAIDSFQAELYRAQPIESFDTISFLGETETGVKVSYHVTHSCKKNGNPELEIRGDRGVVRWIVGENFVFSGDCGADVVSAGRENVMANAFSKAIHAIRAGTPAPCTLEMARGHTALIERIHQNCAIQDIPVECIEILPMEDGATLRHIPGIEDRLRQCFEASKLLSEMMPDLKP